MLTKNMFGLPVETQQGTGLGKLVDIDIDQENHIIRQYYVAPKPFLQKFLSSKVDVLRVAPGNVIKITKEKIVVRDLSNTEPINAYQELLSSGSPEPSSIAHSKTV